MQKRILAVHDISCVGKCSLTVALPILSAAGLEVAALPTAVLSTHTGGFTGYTFRDLTEDITPILNHWRNLDLRIDAIYTGYLGSFEQLRLISGIIDTYKNENCPVLVDPAMADHGKLYALFTDDFVKGMTKLCAKADIIVPNITEAALMLGKEYKEGPYTKEYIENLLIDLSKLGPEKVVLTGVCFDKDKLGAACFDKKENKISYYFEAQQEGYYHGTGDIFASVLMSAICNDKSLEEAIKIAVSFTSGSIRKTYLAEADPQYGVEFETELPNLIRLLQK